MFQSQTRSRSTCDIAIIARTIIELSMFQSQTRSRSTCDPAQRNVPKPWAWRFNLRREAAPHATHNSRWMFRPHKPFQSQTRSRSTCDYSKYDHSRVYGRVSISDEKPLHMRLLVLVVLVVLP